MYKQLETPDRQDSVQDVGPRSKRTEPYRSECGIEAQGKKSGEAIIVTCLVSKIAQFNLKSAGPDVKPC